MKKKTAARSAICRGFCRYYKPGVNEELECEGANVVLRLLCRGKDLPVGGPLTGPALEAGVMQAFQDRVCAACAFREDDCDFILTSGAAQPCGGGVVLLRMFQSGQLALEELELITMKQP